MNKDKMGKKGGLQQQDQGRQQRHAHQQHRQGGGAGRTDIDDSDQAANTRKPSDAGRGGMSDKSGMLNEGDTNRRQPPL